MVSTIHAIRISHLTRIFLLSIFNFPQEQMVEAVEKGKTINK